METTQKKSIQELLAESDKLIEEGKRFLVSEGKVLDLTEWITLQEYTKRHNLKSTMVVSNWIARGIVPPENVFAVDELNGIKLILDKKYKE
ncbi:hypothetical protein [Larkinella rosea]|uniref:Uncharacterized protein n=1 Tax=Larkinella rosea TaxID=2025312 RepID=A0A3P1B992_9BACT|nr:hypothetical protein [Larkinella rosea]RRA97598.1 hypothetical protein EHT25_31610 [Larkinella rosea]